MAFDCGKGAWISFFQNYYVEEKIAPQRFMGTRQLYTFRSGEWPLPGNTQPESGETGAEPGSVADVGFVFA